MFAIEKYKSIRKLNSILYFFMSNRWRWHWRFSDDEHIVIDRPIYLIGLQGGGLTLLSRILRRHHDVISVTGNCSYWAGGDETQYVLKSILPEQLSWRNMRLDGYITDDHSWLYANNDFIKYYRESANAASKELELRYKSILRSILNLNRPLTKGNSMRFLDKNQTLTVRVAFVHRLLQDCYPKFVLLTRDPFVTVWRAVTRSNVFVSMSRSLEERVRLASEHWKNSMRCALEDSKDKNISLLVCRFEDLIRDPNTIIQEVCSHIELPFEPSIMPGPYDDIPWGSNFDSFNKKKWYPIRRDVNTMVRDEMPRRFIRQIELECGDLIGSLGYT